MNYSSFNAKALARLQSRIDVLTTRLEHTESSTDKFETLSTLLDKLRQQLVERAAMRAQYLETLESNRIAKGIAAKNAIAAFDAARTRLDEFKGVAPPREPSINEYCAERCARRVATAIKQLTSGELSGPERTSVRRSLGQACRYLRSYGDYDTLPESIRTWIAEH